MEGTSNLNRPKKSAINKNQMVDIVNYFSVYDNQKSNYMSGFVDELKYAANQATRWTSTGPENPANTKRYSKDYLVEIYGEYAIDLGINSYEETELNMSHEAMQRRQVLRDAEAKKKKDQEEEEKLQQKL